MKRVPLYDSGSPDWMESVRRDVTTLGAAATSGIIPAREVAELTRLLDLSVEADDSWLPQDRWEEEHGRVLFLPRYSSRFLNLLEDAGVMGPCDRILQPDCTLYTMTSSCNEPFGAGRPIHLDCHIDMGEPLVVGVLVLLHEFNETTGSTRFLPQRQVTAPDPEFYEEHALRLDAPAGSVCWFDARLWHDVTSNTTDQRRRCIILAMIRPFVRPRFDLAQMVGHLAPERLTPEIRRRLGFHLVPPGSYHEYYLSADEREERLYEAARSRSAAERQPSPLLE